VPLQNVPPTTDLPPDFVAAHGQVLADKALQFRLLPAPEVKPPEWLKWLEPLAAALGHFFKFFGPFGVYIFWALIAFALGVILFFILRQLGYINWKRRARVEEDTATDWQMRDEPARKLLAEADALAAQGRYEEAAHLLLLRSFEDIAARRPTLLKPAVTSREMSLSEGIPASARDMFAQIARHVEASLFGGGRLGQSGWEECRAAYKHFTLAGDWL
jgi:hypothetical protein